MAECKAILHCCSKSSCLWTKALSDAAAVRRLCTNISKTYCKASGFISLLQKRYVGDPVSNQGRYTGVYEQPRVDERMQRDVSCIGVNGSHKLSKRGSQALQELSGRHFFLHLFHFLALWVGCTCLRCADVTCRWLNGKVKMGEDRNINECAPSRAFRKGKEASTLCVCISYLVVSIGVLLRREVKIETKQLILC